MKNIIDIKTPNEIWREHKNELLLLIHPVLCPPFSANVA